MQLRNRSFFGPARFPLSPGKLLREVTVSIPVTIVLRANQPTAITLRVFPLLNPFRPNAGQSLSHIPVKIGISPRAAGVVHPDRIVGFQLSIRQTGGLKLNLAKGNFQIAPGTLDVDPLHALQGVDLFDFRAAVFAAHRHLLAPPPIHPRRNSSTFPSGGMTRIRLKGLGTLVPDSQPGRPDSPTIQQ